ncbi:MAG: hypothetical protein M0R51_14165 [Clostridia bacterium]|jgi:hypothetical protein|nr:hypothetical protein [Clostridia bacterium]
MNVKKVDRLPFSMVDALTTCFCECEDLESFEDCARGLWLYIVKDANYTDGMQKTFEDIRDNMIEYYWWKIDEEKGGIK